MNILALDIATLTGWALGDGGSGVWNLHPDDRHSRPWWLWTRLGGFGNSTVDRVVFERSYIVKGPAVRVLNELAGVMKLWCELHFVPYIGYTPQDIKKHATSKHNASKDEMVAAAVAKWPDIAIEDHNQADALHLLDMATQRLAEEETTT